MEESTKDIQATNSPENADYYLNESGFIVFTEAFHLNRGYCCGNACLHCPYGEKKNTKAES